MYLLVLSPYPISLLHGHGLFKIYLVNIYIIRLFVIFLTFNISETYRRLPNAGIFQQSKNVWCEFKMKIPRSKTGITFHLARSLAVGLQEFGVKAMALSWGSWKGNCQTAEFWKCLALCQYNRCKRLPPSADGLLTGCSKSFHIS